jgi:hypothetical protein
MHQQQTHERQQVTQKAHRPTLELGQLMISYLK